MCRWLAHTGSCVVVQDGQQEHVPVAPTVLQPAV